MEQKNPKSLQSLQKAQGDTTNFTVSICYGPIGIYFTTGLFFLQRAMTMKDDKL